MRPLERLVMRSPCASHFMDGRMVRALVVASDPSCRVIRPLLARMIGAARRSGPARYIRAAMRRG
jgi:hypothetical protein